MTPTQENRESTSYSEKIQEQIDQYRHTENMHAALPDVQQYYHQRFVKPGIEQVFQVDNFLQFYAHPFMDAIKKTGNTDLISIGSGDGAVEVQVADVLKRHNVDFTFHLAELSPMQQGRAREKATEAGLLEHFRFIEADLNQWQPDRRYAGVMAHHSLHHILELEHVFDAIRSNLDGYFCTIDMIGRNGHMRWPEVLDLVQRFWNIIPAEKRVHATLPGFEEGFYNHDCSTEGFEGIRAQDILPCLIERFGFEKFYAFGGLPDSFVARGFGRHYNMEVDWDRHFIELVATLNNILMETGYIKPTQIYAVMTPDRDIKPRIYRNRSPEFCVRPTD